MKMLAATVALATLIIAPALAQPWYGYDRGSYRLGYYGYAPSRSPYSAYGYAPSRSGYYAYGYAPSRSGYYAYGYAPGRAYGFSWESGLRWRPSPFNVFDTSGNYIGRDPDANVRDQLARDPSQGD